ncbi:MAG: metallophosphoesterase [Lentimicrobium sp.]|jgi:Icc-related predicted phosphoesterase|nr:metallophosphoesterase [Lentimicrobium sp.]
MTTSYFVSDLHGSITRYELLFREIIRNKPSFVFIGGDLLPHVHRSVRLGQKEIPDFMKDYLIPGFKNIRRQLGCNYPEVFVIMGNDDHHIEEPAFLEGEKIELWKYLNNSKFKFGPYTIYGYPFVPPTPFLLKDWEKYDVSRYVDPGCVDPIQGFRTVVPDYDPEYSTIEKDLSALAGSEDMTKAIFLFHTPPYQSKLDRASLDGHKFEHVPLDVHVGSIAVQRFITERQPWITMHGHIHESARITGEWKQQTGRTFSYSAAHDGPELAIVKFRIDNPADCERIILSE